MAKTPYYSVIVSDCAWQMLGAHIHFLAQVNASAARKTKTTLLQAIRSLETMPGRFPFLDAEYIPPNKYHKLFVEKWYLVLHQIKDTAVYVDFIVDCRQDYGWLLK